MYIYNAGCNARECRQSDTHAVKLCMHACMRGVVFGEDRNYTSFRIDTENLGTRILKAGMLKLYTWKYVVISQTISWVSQVRLATVARISVFIE